MPPESQGHWPSNYWWKTDLLTCKNQHSKSKIDDFRVFWSRQYVKLGLLGAPFKIEALEKKIESQNKIISDLKIKMLEGQKKELQQLQHQINLLRMKNSEKEDLIRKLDGDSTEQEAYKGEIQCPVLPNQICFWTNHSKFQAADL